MENTTQESGSQTETSQEQVSTSTDAQNEAVTSAFAAFGLEVPAAQTSAETANTKAAEGEGAPAMEQQEEPRKIKLKPKHNKEVQEREFTEDELTEYVEKGMNLDKVRNQRNEYQQALDRAAKLAGFKDHAAFMQNLDALEKANQRREVDQFNQLRQDLRQQAEDAGLDPDRVEQFIENHPLMKDARRIKQESDERSRHEQERARQAESDAKWSALYEAYPDLQETARAWLDGGSPPWYTAEMQSRIDKGYDPLDAYELAHRDSIRQRTAKAAEQRTIKEQQLGLRSQVETVTTPDTAPYVPAQLSNAFAAFGLDPKAAQKYVKKER